MDETNVLAAGTTTEAVVIWGLTTTELVTICAVAGAVWGPVLGVFGVMVFGNILATLGFILVFIGLSAAVMGVVLRGWKRGRPDGYYQQALQLWLQRHHLTARKFIDHDGRFSLGRTRRIVIERGRTHRRHQ